VAIPGTLQATVRKNLPDMKLFGKREFIISLTGLGAGLIITAFILREKYGEINYLILAAVGLFGLLTIWTVGFYANKK
jgi:hypothetical protein